MTKSSSSSRVGKQACLHDLVLPARLSSPRDPDILRVCIFLQERCAASGSEGTRVYYSVECSTLATHSTLKLSIEMIVEMRVHVMIASQEQCVEMARETNTDRSFCRLARLVYRLLTNGGDNHGRVFLFQECIESVIGTMLTIYGILWMTLIRLDL